MLEKRDPYRAGHLGLIKEMAAEGRVLSAGAFTDPVDGAMFVFTDREAADEFKAKDPYGPPVVAGSIEEPPLQICYRAALPECAARALPAMVPMRTRMLFSEVACRFCSRVCRSASLFAVAFSSWTSGPPA